MVPEAVGLIVGVVTTLTETVFVTAQLPPLVAVSVYTWGDPGDTVTVLAVEPPGLHDQVVALVELAVKVVVAPEQITVGEAVGLIVGVAVTFTLTVCETGHPPPLVTLSV
jgi:hypothetical protein